MKRKVLQTILWVLCLSVQAQKVTNIRAEQRGQDIVVLYSLETTSSCEVSLLLSQDNGTTWNSPLKNLSGDVGKNIAAGERQITWKVLEEHEQLVGDKIKFKVIAQIPKQIRSEEKVDKKGNNSKSRKKIDGRKVANGLYGGGIFVLLGYQIWKNRDQW